MKSYLKELGVSVGIPVAIVSVLLNVVFLTFTNPELKRLEKENYNEMMSGLRLRDFITSLADAQISAALNAPDFVCTDAEKPVPMPPTIPMTVTFRCMPEWSHPEKNDFHISRWIRSREFGIEYSVHAPMERTTQR